MTTKNPKTLWWWQWLCLINSSISAWCPDKRLRLSEYKLQAELNKHTLAYGRWWLLSDWYCIGCQSNKKYPPITILPNESVSCACMALTTVLLQHFWCYLDRCLLDLDFWAPISAPRAWTGPVIVQCTSCAARLVAMCALYGVDCRCRTPCRRYWYSMETERVVYLASCFF